MEREHLGCFFGRYDKVRGPHPWVGGPEIRKTVLSWANEPDLYIHDFTELKSMHSAMGNSKFCFIPRGKSGWSLRFFESLFTNCVPVMLSDQWELPFEDFVDTSKFVIKWPAANTDTLLDFLRKIPDERIEKYMEEARKVRCWYYYPPKKVDVHGYYHTAIFIPRNYVGIPDENCDRVCGIWQDCAKINRVYIHSVDNRSIYVTNV